MAADRRCRWCGAELPRHYAPCNPTRRYEPSGRPIGAPRLELVARMTQTECGRLLGLSRARIQQIEHAAFRKLRAGLKDWRPE